MKLRGCALALILAGFVSGGAAFAGAAPKAEPSGGADAPSLGAGKPTAPGGVSKADQKIDLGDWKGPQSADDLSDAFAAQIEMRYGPEPGLNQIKNDLSANGFACKDVAPVEARADYLLATCEKQETREGCGNIWTVSLRFDHMSRLADSNRVTPRGGFARLCQGAKSN